MGLEERQPIEALLTELETRAAAGDALCGQAAEALRRGETGFAPDAMAAALDRLVHLAREQEAQIRALRAMLETYL